jgi:monoamine oxidase
MSLVPTESDDTNKGMHVKVVIVGAGASGLQCAHVLVANYGYSPADILVLEARDRIGGRIHSTKMRRQRVNGNSDEPPVDFVMDHGAAWVHGTGFDWGVSPKSASAVPTANPMMELLQKTTEESVYSHHLVNVFEGNPWRRPHSMVHEKNEIVLYVAGEELENDDPIVRTALERHYAIFNAVEQYGKDMFDSGRGTETVTKSLEDAISIVQRDLEEPLRSLQKDEALKVKAVARFYQHMLECWYGAPACDLQLCEFSGQDDEDDDEAKADLDSRYTEEGDFYGPHCTLRHGMKSVLQPLLEDGIRDRIRLNQEVTQISLSDETVLVETAGGLLVKAEACVLTIPAGCLKEAVLNEQLFATSLSDEKMDAIKLLSMGSYKKVFLTFDRIFWPKKEAFLGMIRNTQDDAIHSSLGNLLLLDNLWARNDIPCIEAVLFGEAGTWATHKSIEEIRDAVLAFMNDAMTLDEDISVWCTDCEVTRWEEDRFSRGAYSSMGLGAMIRHVEELRRPEWNGRLLFSGEATITEFEGSVHAALFSGKNTAEKVHEVLGSVNANTRRLGNITPADDKESREQGDWLREEGVKAFV